MNAKTFRHKAVAIGAAAIMIALGSANPAYATSGDAAGGEYVALGDSYSAGVGTRDKQDSCYRSPYGYPALLADRYDLSLDYQACGGATTADVLAEQLAALSSNTDQVSMTIGGNDAGYTDVIVECALPAWLSDCAGKIDDGLDVVENDLPARYDTLYAEITSAAPRARVAVGGYPMIFNGEDCNAATFFSPSDEAQLNDATRTLNTLIAVKSADHGFSFVDAEPSFDGHAVCDESEWINGLSNPIEESYHPNRAGNAGYAEIFAPALIGEPYATPVGLSRRQRPAVRPIRAQARAVLAMDLDSRANLAKARDHGIDPDRIERLTQRLRSPDQSMVRRALRSLHNLDRATGRPTS